MPTPTLTDIQITPRNLVIHLENWVAPTADVDASWFTLKLRGIDPSWWRRPFTSRNEVAVTFRLSDFAPSPVAGRAKATQAIHLPELIRAVELVDVNRALPLRTGAAWQDKVGQGLPEDEAALLAFFLHRRHRWGNSAMQASSAAFCSRHLTLSTATQVKLRKMQAYKVIESSLQPVNSKLLNAAVAEQQALQASTQNQRTFAQLSALTFLVCHALWHRDYATGRSMLNKLANHTVLADFDEPMRCAEPLARGLLLLGTWQLLQGQHTEARQTLAKLLDVYRDAMALADPCDWYAFEELSKICQCTLVGTKLFRADDTHPPDPAHVQHALYVAVNLYDETRASVCQSLVESATQQRNRP